MSNDPPFPSQPSPSGTLPPPSPRLYTAEDSEREDGYLWALSICYYVFAGLGFLVLGFLVLHGVIMMTVFGNPENFRDSGQAPPEGLLFVMGGFYIVAGLLILGMMVANGLAGYFIQRRKHRMFSLIVGGINCLQIPLGTALGVFTFILLLKPTVKAKYEQTRLNE